MFIHLKEALQEHFKVLVENNDTLYQTDVSRDELWDTYINSFPIEVRQEYNCNSCRQFIKRYGNIVAIKNNSLVSIWHFGINDSIYQTVISNLDSLVISRPINNKFITDTTKLGTNYTYQLVDRKSIKWDHFYYRLPHKQFTLRNELTRNSTLSEFRQCKQVFKRALDEIEITATETVIDLINQGSLYRGDEFKGLLSSFLQLQNNYKLIHIDERDNYCWDTTSKINPSISKIRNSAIGTLLIDLSEGEDLNIAVTRYERVVAPTNYKRPKPLISNKQIEEAQKTIEQLGYLNSLARRQATLNDVTVNNILFANRATTINKESDIFDVLKRAVTVDVKQLAKVEEIKLDDFIDKVIPTAKRIRLFLENRHENNLISLITAKNEDAPSLFKWNNRFSWCYKNNLADSIKQQVIDAGGKVEGKLRISLAWSNYSDLDLHLYLPNKGHIYYAKKQSVTTGGELDVDMNVSPTTRKPVENIIFDKDSKLLAGNYKIIVNNYTDREPNNRFTVEVEYDNIIHTFEYLENLTTSVTVAEFKYSNKKGLTFTNTINSTTSSKEIWSLATNRFHNVELISYSPNYWDSEVNQIGNKHIFFFLEGCKNVEPVRGIFNEYLKEDLNRNHKRVFEVLASKMVVEEVNKPLCGLGFSTTIKSDFYVEVESTFKRVLKVVV